MFAKLKLDEGSKFRAHMDEVVRGSVEKTLNVIGSGSQSDLRYSA